MASLHDHYTDGRTYASDWLERDAAPGNSPATYAIYSRSNARHHRSDGNRPAAAFCYGVARLLREVI